MSRRRVPFLLLLMGTSALPACVFDEVPLDSLMCPCAEGWQCVEGTCVQGDFVCGRSAASPGVVGVSNLRVLWETPNQVRLQWDPEGSEGLFEYEVDVNEDEAALATNPGERRVTQAENQEFARGFLADAAAADVVDQTTIRELTPDTRYFIRVVATDTSRGISCSNTVAVRTAAPPTDSAVLWGDAHVNPAAGTPVLPECLTQVDDSAQSFNGSAHLAMDIVCQEGSPVCPSAEDPEPVTVGPDRCYENLRVRHLDVLLDLNAGEFMTAYYEVAVAVEDSGSGGWGGLGITTGPEASWTAFGQGKHTFASDGEYHVYQLPLRAIMEPADLLEPIREARAGTGWRSETRVRMDEVFIRW